MVNWFTSKVAAGSVRSHGDVGLQGLFYDLFYRADQVFWRRDRKEMDVEMESIQRVVLARAFCFSWLVPYQR